MTVFATPTGCRMPGPRAGVLRLRRGFTLVEALLSVVILAIAVSMALPRVRAGYAHDMSASVAASKLAGDLRRARLVAIRDPYRDPTTVNRMGIAVRLQPPDAERFTGYELVRLSSNQPVDKPQWFGLTGRGEVECYSPDACAEVRFDPMGVAEGVTSAGKPVAGDARIVVRGPRDVYVLTVRQASGAVEVEKVAQAPV